jgi:hypothetical protein
MSHSVPIVQGAGLDGSGKSHLRPGFDSRPIQFKYISFVLFSSGSRIMVKFVCLRRNVLPVELTEIHNLQGNGKLMVVLRRVLEEHLNLMNRVITVLKETVGKIRPW